MGIFNLIQTWVVGLLFKDKLDVCKAALKTIKYVLCFVWPFAYGDNCYWHLLLRD